MTPEVLGAVRAAIEKNENILISGRDQYRQRDLAPQAVEINGVATRPFEQACCEGGP